jgi:putative acetyltransferase
MPKVTAIRPETATDVAAIHAVEAAAFGREGEASLVDALRVLNQDFISLVATDSEQIVGHTCFSRVSIEGNLDDCSFLALAPLAVLPEHQRRGIGSMLVQAGLEESRQRNADAVFVVGHPDYYSRFGFRPASELGVRCEFEVPDEAFRVIELRPNAVTPGVLRYPQPFHQL